MAHKILNFNDLINVDDRKTDVVDVPEWGGSVKITTLTANQRDKFEAAVVQMNKDNRFEGMRALLVSLCMVNEDGSKFFENEEAAKALGERNSKAVDRIFDACQKLNGMTAEEVGELEGN